MLFIDIHHRQSFNCADKSRLPLVVDIKYGLNFQKIWNGNEKKLYQQNHKNFSELKPKLSFDRFKHTNHSQKN